MDKTIIKFAAVRRLVHDRSGLQVSDEAIALLERHLAQIIEEAEAQTTRRDRRRLDGIIMRAVLHDYQSRKKEVE